jgi:hypothetical protein
MRIHGSIEESLDGIARLIGLILQSGIEHVCWHIVGTLAVN